LLADPDSEVRWQALAQLDRQAQTRSKPLENPEGEGIL